MTQPKADSRTQPSFRRFLLWRLAAVIALPLLIAALGTAFVLQSFNPNRYAPALVAALEQITGRPVTLNGPVTIRWSLTPAIQASDIAIANPPGFPDRNVLTLVGLRAEIALLPLFSDRVDILKLVLVAPHLTLERQKNGNANWDFSTTYVHPTAGAMPFLDSRIKVALEAVEVENGVLTIQADNGKTAGVIHFTTLTGTADSLSTPLHLDAQAEIGATPFGITGIVGPIERFSGIGTAPWPLNLDLTLAGATLSVTGTVKRPRDASGYDLALNLNIPNLNTLGQALPPGLAGRLTLPPIQNITGSAQLRDRNATLPAITNASLTAGKSDLSAFRPGLILNGLNLSMAGLDQPLAVTATGTSGSDNFSLQGQFGALQALLNPALLPTGTAVSGSFPISLTAQLGNATASITGAISTPQTLSGTALAMTANIPDLSALSAAAGTPLPAWKHIALQTSLIDPGGEGLYNAAGLDDLIVTMDNAAFGGAATLNLTPQPKLQLTLNFTQANVDALLAAFPAPTTTTAPATAPTTPTATSATIIPDTALPLSFLSWGNANIQLAADNVTWNGATYTALQATAQLAGSKLTIDPFTGEVPGGNLTASASLDASSTTAAEALSIKAPALALGPLLKTFGLAGTAQGNLQLQLTATSTGNTPHAIAANLSGQLGLASVNSQIDASQLTSIFGPLETAAGLPPAANIPATIRCFGLFIDATQGVATLKTFGLDSSQLFLQGAGSLNLGEESYNVTFQPANGAPLQLGGSFAQPKLAATPQPSAAAPAPATAPPARPDICPATLATARFGQPGPDAPPQTGPITSAVPANSNAPKNLLNSLLSP
jgi:AsmA protein